MLGCDAVYIWFTPFFTLQRANRADMSKIMTDVFMLCHCCCGTTADLFQDRYLYKILWRVENQQGANSPVIQKMLPRGQRWISMYERCYTEIWQVVFIIFDLIKAWIILECQLDTELYTVAHSCNHPRVSGRWKPWTRRWITGIFRCLENTYCK